MFRLCASCNQAQSKQLKHARPSTQGPEPSAARLGPRGFSALVVDSLGGGFVYNINVLWLNNAIR